MANQVSQSIENNFTKGLITEFTGLNFPENAATDCDNVEFSLIGDVNRRLGINGEDNFFTNLIPIPGRAGSTYIWNNAGGNGSSKLYLWQQANTIFFYNISSTTTASSLSGNILPGVTVDLLSFVAAGGTFDSSFECQYSDGNGYLFIYHPSCDPIYVTYVSPNTITSNRISVQIRDFSGVNEASLSSNTRPTSLNAEHNYNLINQGWISGNPWSTTSSSPVAVGLGSKVFTVDAGLTVTLGDQVTIIANHATFGLPATGPMMSGNVTAYAGTSITINVTSGSTGWFGSVGNDWLIIPRDTAYISSWFTSVGNYPSNSDVWWYFKNSSGVFDPGTTITNVSLGAGKAPRGHFILDTFSQQRDVISNLAITDVQTTVRPRTGAWFQGRVWYAGADAQQPATGDAAYYSWTESIYFSQIVQSSEDFGHCYQTNDPTSENLFDLLPTDGGVIQIQGCGSIYKLFSIQNGLLVFAANGIWFITGSVGIGFAANDYTVQKISSVQCISGTSFVNVQGLPYFWNEEGIYQIQPTQGGGLTVEPITIGTILSFYNSIPTASKKYARGDYHPIDYIIQWTYRSTEETSITDRYHFDKILNYSTYNKAFFPYSVGAGITNAPFINGVNYISYPQIGNNTPAPGFKYPMTFFAVGSKFNTFAEANDSDYLDWKAVTGGTNYVSYFLTGYKLKGKAVSRFQPLYVIMFLRNEGTSSYKIQGVWDYANSGNSGRYSTIQRIDIDEDNFGMVYRRHKIRGHGLALQLKITSSDGLPFDIMGWSSIESVEAGIY